MRHVAGISEKYTKKDFATAFTDLAKERFGSSAGKVDLRPLLSQVEGYSYEALRLMLKGQRTLKMEAIEGMSKVVGVSPHYFCEYRQMWASKMMQRHPELCDRLYDMAKQFVEGKSD
jgi:hypothetical protein